MLYSFKISFSDVLSIDKSILLIATSFLVTLFLAEYTILENPFPKLFL